MMTSIVNKTIACALLMAATAISAQQDALFIDPDGNVGIGTNSPTSPLTVRGSSSSDQTMLNLINNAHPIFRLQDASQPNVRWEFRIAGNQNSTEQFLINKIGSGNLQMRLFHSGDMQIGGTLEENSSSRVKHAVEEIEPQEILEKLGQLRIAEWSYNQSPENRHLGPMAEQFYELFQFGSGKDTVSARNLASVALASVKALREENAELKTRLAKLEGILQEN